MKPAVRKRVAPLKRAAFLLSAAAFAIVFLHTGHAQSSGRDTALTVEEVVKLHRAGFSEELIITRIKKNGKAFNLSTEELVDLKKEGLSENIIRFLLDPAQPYTPPAPTSPSTSAAKSSGAPKKYPDDPLASRVPPDPALYLFPDQLPAKVDLKVLLGMHKGKALMKKGRTVAYLVGPAAKLRAKAARPAFYLRLPDGKEITDVVLVALIKKDGRREVDGTAGPKVELKSDAMRQFEHVEVGSRLFKLTPEKLTSGEYLFLLIASEDPSKGVYGKGFDFAVDAERERK